MRRSSRRQFVAVAATLGVGGCLGRTGSGTESGTEADSTATAEPGSGGDSAATAESTATPEPVHPGYETREVTVRDESGVLGRVTAAVADSYERRYRGLSDTASLPEDRGMLFVYGAGADRTFVMRGMDFGIDIVYADADGTITRIHHAPEPGPGEDGDRQRYPGRGQYVLEVNSGWTTERGVEVGDRLLFDL